MSTFIVIMIVLLAALAIYSAAVVTYHTVISDYFDKNQKIMIICLAWLIPIVGPAIIFGILSEDKEIRKSRGIPLLDLIFLSAVFSHGAKSADGCESNSDGISSNFGGGGGDGDT